MSSESLIEILKAANISNKDIENITELYKINNTFEVCKLLIEYDDDIGSSTKIDIMNFFNYNGTPYGYLQDNHSDYLKKVDAQRSYNKEKEEKKNNYFNQIALIVKEGENKNNSNFNKEEYIFKINTGLNFYNELDNFLRTDDSLREIISNSKFILENELSNTQELIKVEKEEAKLNEFYNQVNNKVSEILNYKFKKNINFNEWRNFDKKTNELQNDKLKILESNPNKPEVEGLIKQIDYVLNLSAELNPTDGSYSILTKVESIFLTINKANNSIKEMIKLAKENNSEQFPKIKSDLITYKDRLYIEIPESSIIKNLNAIIRKLDKF